MTYEKALEAVAEMQRRHNEKTPEFDRASDYHVSSVWKAIDKGSGRLSDGFRRIIWNATNDVATDLLFEEFIAAAYEQDSERNAYYLQYELEAEAMSDSLFSLANDLQDLINEIINSKRLNRDRLLKTLRLLQRQAENDSGK